MRELDEILSDVEERDPGVALPAVAELREWLDDAEDDAVTRAVIEGWSYARIGEALGRSKQAVWHKYADRLEQARGTIDGGPVASG